MSVFGRILERLTGRAQAAGPAATPAPEAAAQGGSPPPPGPADDAATAGQPSALNQVDLAALLDGMAKEAPQKLDWRRSIVDLMKLLGLDSSLGERQELARELGYGGDMGDSAAMNLWLHRQVMDRLAANGGQVPAELRS